MNNDALVAALGMDAVAGVPGYRLAVCARVDLDEDPDAIRRLLGFLDRRSAFSTVEAFVPTPPRAGRQ
jgi:hypothetical protein